MGLAEMTASSAPAGRHVDIEVWVSLAPRSVTTATVQVPLGTPAGQALEATGWIGQLEGLDATGLHDGLKDGRWVLAIWGRKVAWSHPLREGDRLELLRGLKVDPKEARRQRYRAQGEKLPKGIHRSPKKSGSAPEA